MSGVCLLLRLAQPESEQKMLALSSLVAAMPHSLTPGAPVDCSRCVALAQGSEMDAGSLCSSIDEESERPLTTLLRWLGYSHHHDQLLATGARTASVAVVGSSGNLLNSRSGRLIDEHTVECISPAFPGIATCQIFLSFNGQEFLGGEKTQAQAQT